MKKRMPAGAVRPRPVQYFSEAYLEQCRKMSSSEILDFVENFRLLQEAAAPVKSRLISMKVAEPLLAAFRTKAEAHGVAYQTQIKTLMRAWLEGA